MGGSGTSSGWTCGSARLLEPALNRELGQQGGTEHVESFLCVGESQYPVILHLYYFLIFAKKKPEQTYGLCVAAAAVADLELWTTLL